MARSVRSTGAPPRCSNCHNTLLPSFAAIQDGWTILVLSQLVWTALILLGFWAQLGQFLISSYSSSPGHSVLLAAFWRWPINWYDVWILFSFTPHSISSRTAFRASSFGRRSVGTFNVSGVGLILLTLQSLTWLLYQFMVSVVVVVMMTCAYRTLVEWGLVRENENLPWFHFLQHISHCGLSWVCHWIPEVRSRRLPAWPMAFPPPDGVECDLFVSFCSLGTSKHLCQTTQ